MSDMDTQSRVLSSPFGVLSGNEMNDAKHSLVKQTHAIADSY